MAEHQHDEVHAQDEIIIEQKVVDIILSPTVPPLNGDGGNLRLIISNTVCLAWARKITLN